MKEIKALVLFSGGLDSVLAAEALKKQGVEVQALSFESYFFNADQAEDSARRQNIPLKVVDISEEHLRIVKSPRFGRGSGMNPCIDCHLLMLKKAKEVMDKEGFDFVATGEVLGERPMSQNQRAMEVLKKRSGLGDLLVRPLSAKLLEETAPEKRGWIKRKELFDISGRSRKKQMELAERWGIEDYPSPAGGCILCENEFAKKLETLFKRYPEADGDDVKLLKTGRHFWEEGIKIVVGRDHEENLILEGLAQKGDLLVKIMNIPGPTALIRSYGAGPQDKALVRAKRLVKRYANKARGEVDYEVRRLKE